MTDSKTQSKIINYFMIKLSSIKTNNPTRGGKHLRTWISGNFEPILNSVVKVKIEPADKQISGTFPGYLITTLKDIDGFKKGTSFYYVNAKSSKGVVSDKEFTPDALGFAGNIYNAVQLEKELLNVIPKHPKYLKVGNVLESLIKTPNKINTTGVSQTDLNKIYKDFGELSGALYLLKNTYKNSKVFFPLASNEPLIDYIIELPDKTKRKISAKAGKGAPPSINVVSDKLKTGEIPLSNSEKKLSQVIIDIADNSTIDGILEASKTYETPGYKVAEKILGKGKVTRNDIINFFNQFGTWEYAKKQVEPFYKASNRYASDMIGNKIYDNNRKKEGLIISPLGYHLVDVLNKDKDLLKLLNKVLSSLTVEQLYLNVIGSKSVYNLVPFKEGKFVFHYNANAGEPSLKKISFKMKV